MKTKYSENFDGNLKKYNKNIRKMAKELGIDTYKSDGTRISTKKLYKNILKLDLDDGVPNESDVITIELPKFTETDLKSKKKQELITIASSLGLDKIEGKSIKYATNPKIIEHILLALKSEPSNTHVVLESPIPPENMNFSKVYLKSKSKAELLSIAEEYNIEKWNNKLLRRQKIDDIIDAIINFADSKVPHLEPITIEKPVNVVKFTKENLSSKTKPDLLLIAEECNIKKWNNKTIKTQKKSDIIDAILNFFEIETNIPPVSLECNPVEGIYCTSDNVCDIDQKPNMCISSQDSLKKEEDSNIVSWEYMGKKIVGSKVAIDNLRFTLTEKPSVIIQPTVQPTKVIICKKCSCDNDPDRSTCLACHSNLNDSDIQTLFPPEGTTIIEVPDNLPEGIEVPDIRNVEDILKDIQKSEDMSMDDINNLDDATKKVLKCLGVISM